MARYSPQSFATYWLPLRLMGPRVTGAMQLDAGVWWDTMHSSRFDDVDIEKITWDRFVDTFYEQYFSETV